jgi:hypothetical protein
MCHTMAASREALQEPREIAAVIRLPDYYADAPQAWFCQINSTFAASPVQWPLTKLHWAVSKLPSTMVVVLGTLCNNPTAVADPYAEQELQAIFLRSYDLSTGLLADCQVV